MKTIPPWVKITSGLIAFIAATFTAIIYGRDIVNWLFPREPLLKYGETLVEYVSHPFAWPSTYSAAPEEHKRFFENSQSFARIELYNVSKLDTSEIRLLLSTDAIIEVATRGKEPAREGIADNFMLGSIPAGERVVVTMWTKRPLTADDKVTVGTDAWTAQFVGSLVWTVADIEFYQTGFNVLIYITAVLAIVLFVLVLWLVFRRPKKKRQARATRSRTANKKESPTTPSQPA
jgi:hypothetical protein